MRKRERKKDREKREERDRDKDRGRQKQDSAVRSLSYIVLNIGTVSLEIKSSYPLHCSLCFPSDFSIVITRSRNLKER